MSVSIRILMSIEHQLTSVWDVSLVAYDAIWATDMMYAVHKTPNRPEGIGLF